jgi:outer membrane protein OmpA-like peptidoglycan-associated protein
MRQFFHGRGGSEEESDWLSVSDLMAGLMMVFLIVAVALMREAFEERDKVKQVALTYEANQSAIFNALNTEFAKDLSGWDAVLDKETLTLTFESQEVLFALGKNELSDRYKRLLDSFMPRYMSVLHQYSDSIEEVRIEGHTSSGWSSSATTTQAYFFNMELSQGRTRSVLAYVFQMPAMENYREWIKSHVSAVGLSSSHVVKTERGEEDRDRSRRVTFRVITNADAQIKQILQRK